MKVAVRLVMYIDVPTRSLDRAIDTVKYAAAPALGREVVNFTPPKKPTTLLRFGRYEISKLDEKGKPYGHGW